MYQKTAKDIAYDKEREKFRSKIKALEKEIRDLVVDIGCRDAIIENNEQCICELKEENTRLRELLKIPAEQLDQYLKDASEKAERDRELTSALSPLTNMMHLMGY